MDTHHTDPVIPPEILVGSGATLHVLDARPVAEFEAGHLRGAVHLPIGAWERAAKSAEGALSNAEFWRAEIGSLGVSGRRPVVVLDDGRMTEAARAWFILQHFGVPALVADGGWAALAPLLTDEVETGEVDPPEPAEFAAQPGTGRVALVERTQLREALAGSGARPQVLDARTAAEHRGEDLRRNPRGGHLPGAVNLPHLSLLDERGRFLAPERLRDMLERAGLARGGNIVTHCDGGGRAALAALAALRAGYERVGTYYLSFADWAADETCPVER